MVGGEGQTLASWATDLVEAEVKPGDLVVEKVPHEALEVEEQQAGEHLSQQLRQGRGLLGQAHRPQAGVEDGQREDEHQVVVERHGQAAAHRGPADGAVRLQLVAAQVSPPGRQQVQQQEGQTAAQEDRQREDGGEEGGAEEGRMSQQERPDRLQQHSSAFTY